jgi:retinol dehydrogenase 12
VCVCVCVLFLLREKGSSVTVNAVHPGIVLTEVTRSLPAFVRYAHALAMPVMMLLQKLPRQGAYCSIFAAVSPEVARTSGQYLMHCRIHPTTVHAQDMDAAARLWDVSLELTGEK